MRRVPSRSAATDSRGENEEVFSLHSDIGGKLRFRFGGDIFCYGGEEMNRVSARGEGDFSLVGIEMLAFTLVGTDRELYPSRVNFMYAKIV